MGRPGHRTALAALASALLAGGCGTPSADLFVVHRSGGIPGARLTMLVGDGGTVRCNRGPEHAITSKQLIEARRVLDDLSGEEEDPGPLRRHLRLPAQPNSILRYAVRAEHGTVAFSDTSRGQPRAFYDLARLVRELAKGPCGLPR